MIKNNKLHLCAAMIIILVGSQKIANPAIADQSKTTPLWVFSKFKEAKTPAELNRLTIGLPQSTDHLLSTECKLAEAKPDLPVSVYVKGLKNSDSTSVQVKFYRGQFEQTLSGRIITPAINNAAAKILIDIPTKAPLWNALLALKGMTMQVTGTKPITFNLVRGSQQRVSNFLQSCRSKSIALNTNKDAEKTVTRKYFCKDGSILNVKLIVSGTIPFARLTHNDAEDVLLDPSVSASGIIYQNQNYKLEMRGFEAILKTNEEQLTCSTNLSQN